MAMTTSSSISVNADRRKVRADMTPSPVQEPMKRNAKSHRAPTRRAVPLDWFLRSSSALINRQRVRAQRSGRVVSMIVKQEWGELQAKVAQNVKQKVTSSVSGPAPCGWAKIRSEERRVGRG